MRESVKAATHAALLSQIQRATEQADVTRAVEEAASEAARALVGETLGNAPRRSLPKESRPVYANPHAATIVQSEHEEAPTLTHLKPGRNGKAVRPDPK
jgi:hypothetical protein